MSPLFSNVKQWFTATQYNYVGPHLNWDIFGTPHTKCCEWLLSPESLKMVWFKAVGNRNGRAQTTLIYYTGQVWQIGHRWPGREVPGYISINRWEKAKNLGGIREDVHRNSPLSASMIFIALLYCYNLSPVEFKHAVGTAGVRIAGPAAYIIANSQFGPIQIHLTSSSVGNWISLVWVNIFLWNPHKL